MFRGETGRCLEERPAGLSLSNRPVFHWVTGRSLLGVTGRFLLGVPAGYSLLYTGRVLPAPIHHPGTPASLHTLGTPASLLPCTAVQAVTRSVHGVSERGSGLSLSCSVWAERLWQACRSPSC